MPLTELKIKNLKPRKSRYLLADGQGLYIAVMPTGVKYWYVRTWRNGKETKVSIGKYPDISLKEARELAHESKSSPKQKPAVFRDVLEDWFRVRYLPSVQPETSRQTRCLIDLHVLPALGHYNISDITPPELLRIARKMQDEKGAFVGNRFRALVSRVLRYAVAAGLCEWNPAEQITGALAPNKPTVHRVPDDPLAALRAVMPVVRSAPDIIVRLPIMLIAYTFVRANEACGARWSEIDGDTWIIPAKRMKGKRDHVVPLSRQALSIIEQARSMGLSDEYVFGSLHGASVSYSSLQRFMLNAAPPGIRFTLHSFRGCASTILNENGFRPDIIELQLAHADKNAVRASYNKAQHLDERRRMIQWYADSIDSL